MEQKELKRGLLPRHVRLMAIGGTIGTGIFMGSGETLSLAGPGVIFSYLFAGLLLLVVMSALAELAVVYPSLNIQAMIRKAFGSRFSFIIGWLYWITWVLVASVDILASGNFLQYWFPSVPLWVLSLLMAVCILAINTASVKHYGEVEFWFAGIKIITLILFILLGVSLVFGFFPHGEAPGLTNYTAHGGFLPNGWGGVLSALLIVLFSFGGAELVGMTITETKDVTKVMPKIIRGVIGRIIIFYTLPILVICGMIPWDKVSSHASPFIDVLTATGMQGVAHIMNFVLLTAVLSAANSGVYASSRMLYSLAKEGEAPAPFARLTKKGIPGPALVAGGAALFLGVFAAYLTPDKIFGYLMGIPGFTVMLLWISVCLVQLKLRPHYPVKPTFMLWLYPYTTSVTAGMLFIIFIAFLFNKDNLVSSVFCLCIIGLLFLVSFFKDKSGSEQDMKETVQVK
jgi:AAT family amino acid transporter